MKPKPAAPATGEEHTNEAQALAHIAAWASRVPEIPAWAGRSCSLARR
jgi:hypothetical protein